MVKSEGIISVVFEDPFWVALFERYSDDQYSVARAVIGTSEPTNSELMLFFDQLDYERLSFTTPVEDEHIQEKKLNFKRQQRQAKKVMEDYGMKHVYTKAAAQLKLQFEQEKKIRKEKTKADKELAERQKFELRQLKKKKKHRGH